MRTLAQEQSRLFVREALRLARRIEQDRGVIRSPGRRSALIAFRHRHSFKGPYGLQGLIHNLRAQLA